MKSKYKNVYWHAGINKWVAKVRFNYKSFHLGCFLNEEDANNEVIRFKADHKMSTKDGEIPSLHDRFEYRNGRLFSRFKSSHISVGDEVGSVCGAHGYVMIGHGGRLLKAHRVVWELFNGPIPSGYEIDHINGRRDDNRIENLRCVTRADNTRNRCIPKNNSTGTMGVKARANGKYQAVVDFEKKRIHLGTFENIDLAIAARLSAETSLGFHKNHGRKSV